MLQATQFKGGVDFGVITIREDEFDAVLKRFPPHHHVRGRRTYVISIVTFPDGKTSVLAIVRCPEQGTSCAQAVATDLIEDFAPRWLAVVGIAGAAPSREYSLGDVVIATRVDDFRVEAVLSSGERTYDVRGAPCHRDVTDFIALLPAIAKIQKPGTPPHPLTTWNTPESIGRARPEIGQAEHLFYGDEESWQKEVKEGLLHRFRSSAPLHARPLFTAGTIASSDRLIKDDEILETWKRFARSTLAIEMEMAGVMVAARHHTKEYPVLGVRGISDVVGYKRDYAWTLYACETAAAFFHALVLSRPLQPPKNDRPWVWGLLGTALVSAVVAMTTWPPRQRPPAEASPQILIAPRDVTGLMDRAHEPRQWFYEIEFQPKTGEPVRTPLPRDGILIGTGPLSPALRQEARSFKASNQLPEVFEPLSLPQVKVGEEPTLRAVLYKYSWEKKSHEPCAKKELLIPVETKGDTFWPLNITDYCS